MERVKKNKPQSGYEKNPESRRKGQTETREPEGELFRSTAHVRIAVVGTKEIGTSDGLLKVRNQLQINKKIVIQTLKPSSDGVDSKRGTRQTYHQIFRSEDFGQSDARKNTGGVKVITRKNYKKTSDEKRD